MRTSRALLAIACAIGSYYFFGLSVLTWAYSLLQGLTAAFVLLLGLAWDVLRPGKGSLEELPHVHRALFNVTRDATRVADLLHEFLQQHPDPALEQQFVAFLDAKANTSYSYVDQQLSWVLWLYSIIWMPLLLFTCFKRSVTAKSSRHDHPASIKQQQKQQQGHVSTGTRKAAAAAGGGSGDSSSTAGSAERRVKPFMAGTTRSPPQLCTQATSNGSCSRRERGGVRGSTETARAVPSQRSIRDSFSSSMYRPSQEFVCYDTAAFVQHKQLPWDGERQQRGGERALRRTATIAAATGADEQSSGAPLEEDLHGSLPQKQLQLWSDQRHLEEQQQQWRQRQRQRTPEVLRATAAKAITDGRGKKGSSRLVKRIASDGSNMGQRGGRGHGSGEWDVSQLQDQRAAV